MCIIAGDVTGDQRISKLPSLAAAAGVPYVFTRSKHELSAFGHLSFATAALLVTAGADGTLPAEVAAELTAVVATVASLRAAAVPPLHQIDGAPLPG